MVQIPRLTGAIGSWHLEQNACPDSTTWAYFARTLRCALSYLRFIPPNSGERNVHSGVNG